MDKFAATSIGAVSLYALLSAFYKGVQTFYSDPATIPPAKRSAFVGSGIMPSVDVIVPCFNEDPCTLFECLSSIASQEYSGKLQIYVVDDGSDNRGSLAQVHDVFAHDPRFVFINLEDNVGKRKAQISAIRRSTGDLVLNIDSDTTADSDVVAKLALRMRDPSVGAVMGQLTASNRRKTWLTRLIDMEYWLACNEERAAQGRFGAVMCCCGPCAMYRRSALLLLIDRYETQVFRGRISNFGEDRHLTILMLEAGFRTEYVPDACVATVVPDRLSSYLRQQLRWARSTYRDTLLALYILPRLDGYLTLDVIGQNIGLLLLTVSLIAGIAQVFSTASVPWWPSLMIVLMTIIRCCVASVRARQLRFLGFLFHMPINIFLLIPLKIYALFTISNSNWLSRGSPYDGQKSVYIKSVTVST
ncbi:chitooligosaccharide synthase NodC [Methylobacterium sp. WSM2598]|uniref:chitooligosaccharide synthase NodC n=1 Tax=Methylobacterium sp. WSM2598 TaxID=398261 RepID=UPI00039FB11B|nr:chitooligosaccharide synthase NodC [Methylobacterium sp. WSM2598]